MYCSSCGESNQDDAFFCRNCGNQIQIAGVITLPQVPATIYSPVRSTPRIPTIAAVLNLLFGLGYWYLGYRTVFGVPTTVFVILALIVYIVVAVFTAGIVSVLIALLLAYDGYRKANGQKGFIPAEM